MTESQTRSTASARCSPDSNSFCCPKPLQETLRQPPDRHRRERRERKTPNAFLSPPTSGTLFDVLIRKAKLVIYEFIVELADRLYDLPNDTVHNGAKPSQKGATVCLATVGACGVSAYQILD